MPKYRMPFVAVGTSLVAVAAIVVAAGKLDTRLETMLANAWCDTHVLGMTPSPDGRAILVTFMRDCGAPTGFNTQASVMAAGVRFSPEGYPAFVSVGGKHPPFGRWIGERQVEIALPAGETVYRRDNNAAGFEISYR